MVDGDGCRGIKRVGGGCKQEAPLHNTGGKPGIMDGLIIILSMKRSTSVVYKYLRFSADATVGLFSVAQTEAMTTRNANKGRRKKKEKGKKRKENKSKELDHRLKKRSLAFDLPC